MTREEVLAEYKRLRDALVCDCVTRGAVGITTNIPMPEVLGFIAKTAERTALDALVFALLEAEPRKPDGWAEGNWRDKMRRHRVISLYATREADSDIPVYIGAQPEVEK